jgi:vacuolar-type H+-ATPase subunit H
MSALPDGIEVAGQAPAHPEEGRDPIVAIGRTVSEAAGTMTELHEVFDRLRALLVLAREEHDNEVKIGELFLRAQEHVNRAVADAEKRTKQLLADAELEAARIVTAAEREAHRLLEEARRPAMDPSVTEQLQKTIDGFAQVNRELQSELTSLVRSMTEHAPAPSTTPRTEPAEPVGNHNGNAGPTSDIPPPPVVAPAPGLRAPDPS